MLKKLSCLALCVLTLLPTLFSCAPEPDAYEGKLILARDGESNYQIVLPQNASEALRGTAGELQTYLLEISDVLLPVVDDSTEAHTHEIILGDTSRSEGTTEIDRRYLGEEGFCIRNVGDNILIAGGGDRGTLYGVYAFLEEYLGVRYWAEGEETVPHLQVAALDYFDRDNLQKPGFDFRLQSHQTASSYTEKMHLNAAWSGDDQPIAGGIEYTGPWYVHTFGTLLGWSSGQSYRTQPCLSDQAVFEKMYASACKYIEQNPNATVISISQNDSTLSESGECTCDKCRSEIEKYGSSGALLNFVNRMANALKSKYPYIYVETLAYYYTQEPPKGGVTANENVIVRFCNAGGCMMHSLSEEDPASENFYPQNNNRAYEALKGWTEAAENLYIWDYDTDFGSVLSSIPNFKRLYDNITLYYELGVDGIYMQGLRDGGEFDRLRGYLASKLLWNPKMSYEEYEALMQEFLLGYYGSAGEEIQSYIDYLSGLCADTHPSMYYDITRFWPMQLNADNSADRTHLDMMKAYYNAALAEAETYEKERRVRRTLLPILYYETLLCAMETDAQGAEPDELVSLNQALYEEMQLAGIDLLKEGVSMPKLPNFKNTLLYWGWDGACIYNSATAEAHEEAKKATEEAANSAGETSESEEESTEPVIDVTQGQDAAEEEAAI